MIPVRRGQLPGLDLAVPLAVALDAGRLGAVVHEALAEPGVLQRLLGRDAPGGIVDEDALEQVEEELVEGGRGRDDVLWQKGRSACFPQGAMLGNFGSVGNRETYGELLHVLDVIS